MAPIVLLLLQRVILSLINSQFGEYVVSIYHIEIKDTSGTARSTSYFDIMGFKLLNCLSSVKIVVDYCLSVCPFSFGKRIGCLYSFWSSFWCFQQTIFRSRLEYNIEIADLWSNRSQQVIINLKHSWFIKLLPYQKYN